MEKMRDNRDYGPPFDMHCMGFPRMPPPIPPPRDLYYHEGEDFLEQDITRELSRFRGPDPRISTMPEYFPNRDPYNDRGSYDREYSDRSQGRGRDMDYERNRSDSDYRHRDRERSSRWERENDYRDEPGRDRYRDHSGYRGRDRERERDRDLDDDRRDYDRRDRDRDRDWDRSRSSRDDYSKEEPRHRRERTTRWDDGYEEHRERKREAREKEKRSEREKEAEFKSDNEPTSVIMLRGLRDEIKEDDILEELYSAEVAFKDVRIVRNKIGYTRGFGFVEFDTVESAKQWMDHIKGRLICQGFSIGADYSRPKNAQDKDWNCPKCGTQNFSSRRRTTCFSCGTPKEVSGDDKESSNPPCKVLILKGLDVLTNEETVRTMLSSITTLPIYDIRLIRDKLTSTSRGFCFVELASIEDATNFLEELSSMNPPFEIDGRIINTLYAKNSEPAPASKPSNVATAAIEQAQWSSTPQQNNSAAAAMAIAQAQSASQSSYSSQYQQPLTSGTAQQETASSSSTASTASTSNSSAALPFAAPPMTNFVYDTLSGYYYDSVSGLYYDSTTQYYYNGTTGQYSYWDTNIQQYVPVAADGSAIPTTTDATTKPSSSTPTTTTTPTTNTTSTPTPSTEAADSLAAKEKQKKAKTLQAKKIAKDMERWARNVNAAKAQHQPPSEDVKKTAAAEEPEFKKPTLPPPKLLTVLNKAATTSDATVESVKVMSSPLSGMIVPIKPIKEEEEPPPGSKWSSLIAEYGEDDDSDPEPEEPVFTSDQTFADFKLMACLLCKRQFPNKEGLDRHIQFSDLHKQNIDIHKKMNMTDKQRDEIERRERDSKYRDRAKERRAKYNQPDIGSTFTPPAPSRKRKPFQPTSKYEQPTKTGIGSENIGNQMLRAMGWSQGTGLGKDGQGIVDPIKAQMRTQYAGLGSAGSSYGSVTGAETPREKRQKLAMSRFNES